MRRTSFSVFGGALLLFAGVAAAGAQDQGNTKKPPKQTPDRGIDDADGLPPGQEKKLGERNTEAVTVTTLPSGVIMAQLDESFEDALVVTRDADGTIRYTCLHGLPVAARHAIAAPQPQPVSIAPALEEQ
ncbi:MAG: hypothetical protein HY824_12345 [Acidobacteria bacterium]|nr:hypothetical protein [Acidobacteriota bacterium]